MIRFKYAASRNLSQQIIPSKPSTENQLLNPGNGFECRRYLHRLSLPDSELTELLPCKFAPKTTIRLFLKEIEREIQLWKHLHEN